MRYPLFDGATPGFGGELTSDPIRIPAGHLAFIVIVIGGPLGGGYELEVDVSTDDPSHWIRLGGLPGVLGVGHHVVAHPVPLGHGRDVRVRVRPLDRGAVLVSAVLVVVPETQRPAEQDGSERHEA